MDQPARSSSRTSASLIEPALGWSYLSREALARGKARIDEKSTGVRDEIGFLTIHQGYCAVRPTSRVAHDLSAGLGQPNQEDFIEVLSRGGEATRALLQPSPFICPRWECGKRRKLRTALRQMATGHCRQSALLSSKPKTSTSRRRRPRGFVVRV